MYAHRTDAVDHDRYRVWLEETVGSESAFGMSELILSAFVRVVTHPRIFPSPTPLDKALAQADDLRGQPNCVVVTPGPRHWEIFSGLCTKADARGDLASDAYFAALAVEAGCEWITTDRDFSRFPGLRWRHPLAV